MMLQPEIPLCRQAAPHQAAPARDELAAPALSPLHLAGEGAGARSVWPRGHACGIAAFSLLEMIGVLAIIAIVAAMAIPSLIRHMDLAARAEEKATLARIQDGLLLYVQRSNSIPEPNNWQQAVSTWSALAMAHLEVNPRKYPRLYFAQEGGSPFPYTQSVLGTTQPDRLRVIIVSILGGESLNAGNCPGPNGGLLPEADFNALWDTPEGSRPTTGLWANWNGKADDFLAQRIDFAPLFHRLVLVNRDALNLCSFTINGSSAITITNSANNLGWDAWYLHGSVVALCGASDVPIPPPMTRHVLTEDISFVFEEGLWRAQIMGLQTGNSQADDFGDRAASFLAAQWYAGAHQGADQQGALTAMYSFMYIYTLWANQCPHFESHGIPSPGSVPEYLLLDSVGRAKNPDQPNGTGGRLDEFTGQNGLLK